MRHKIRLSLLNLLLGIPLLSAGTATAANPNQICLYKDERGKMNQVMSLQAVPERYRKTAQCLSEKDGGGRMAAPSEVTLEGSQRLEDMTTSIGRIHLRWERKSERLFGRTPVRAMSDAANTVSRAIKNAAFPSAVQGLSQEWNIVFLGDNVPAGQIPLNLITNCHPGWMTPPANIYIVSDRVAGGCGSRHASTSVADSTLTEVLLHEMGHAVEYQLLEKSDRTHDRMRAEGFATFFEQYASRYSSVVSPGKLKERNYELAKQAIQHSPEYFQFTGTGTALEYSRAAMYFIAIEEKLGLRSVVQIYEAINKKALDFFSAIKEATGWDDRRREREVRSLLKIS